MLHESSLVELCKLVFRYNAKFILYLYIILKIIPYNGTQYKGVSLFFTRKKKVESIATRPSSKAIFGPTIVSVLENNFFSNQEFSWFIWEDFRSFTQGWIWGEF